MTMIADPIARAIVDLGRTVLIGLGIGSLALVDVGWLRQVLGRLVR